MLKLLFFLFFNSTVEFLPVSSTAHGILLNKFLTFDFKGLNTDLILAFAQLSISLALCFYFKNEIIDIIKSLFKNGKNTTIFLLKIATTMLPTVFIGLLFYKFIKNIFSSEKSIAICLIFGAVLMLFAEKKYSMSLKKNFDKFEDIDFIAMLKIGLLQSLSIIPGISRSASTISAGLLCNLDRKIAVRFSFFISIPISAVASLFDIYKNIEHINTANAGVILYCIVLSFVFSIIFSGKIIKFLTEHSLNIFAYYRIIFGIFLLLL